MLVGERSRFEILPAIDLIAGRVIRLRQGDFARADVYSDDPVEVARRFAATGVGWLHIVDLDGARAGHPVQSSIIATIVESVGRTVSCEVAGGLRTEAAVAAAFAAGTVRAVLGTAALEDVDLVARMVRRHGPSRLVAAIDARGDAAVGGAWQAGGPSESVPVAVRRLVAAGITVFEVTAVDRDGLLAGPDLDLVAMVVDLDVDVIASGGIRSIEDLLALRAAGCVGAIVGRALYDRSLDLAEALAATA